MGYGTSLRAGSRAEYSFGADVAARDAGMREKREAAQERQLS
jgi:hypothetical protein